MTAPAMMIGRVPIRATRPVEMPAAMPTPTVTGRYDLAVCDLSSFIEDAATQKRFGGHRPEAFFEVKWMLKGWRGQHFEMDAGKRVEQIPADLAKLARHVELERCSVAGMLIFDDEGYFEEYGGEILWPPGV